MTSAVTNLREQIKVRGLTVRSGYKDTPLSHFKATLSNWDAYNQPATQPGYRDRVMVRLQFDESDIEVIHSDSPYTHPNAAIEVPYSDNGIREDGQGNGWAFFAKSAERIIPEGQGLDALQGHNLEIEWRDTYYATDGEVKECRVWAGQQRPNETVMRQCWILVGADGVNWSGGVSGASISQPTEVTSTPHEDILAAINGKNKVEANQELMALEHVRTSRMEDILNGKIYSDLIESGAITLDDAGIYHRV